MEKKIEKIILDFIGKNYGGQEMDDPCYNIRKLSKYIVKELEKKENE